MKQTFGINNINKATPQWAKWFFRVVFFFNKIIAGYIAATNLIDPAAKYEITLFLTLVLDPVAFFFSKLFHIELEEDENPDVQADAPEGDIGGGGIKNPPPTNP